jgi:uncharacterized protein YjiK
MKKLNLFIGIGFSLLLVFSGCGGDDPQMTKSLSLLNSKVLNIPETSGLSYYKYPNTLLTVSDQSDRVYVISFDGDVLDSLTYEGSNLEGVVYDAQHSHIYVVEEHTNEVVQLDTVGNELNRFAIELNNTDPGHGLEGISINPATGHLFVVSEKSPSILFELKTNGEIVNQYNLDFMEDYSSVFYEETEGMLWILSDQSRLLVKCDLSGNPLDYFNTGVNDAEGNVIDIATSKARLVTDASNALFTFSF